MNSWGFALKEGVFAETKEEICSNKNLKKLALKNQDESESKCRTASCDLLVSRLRHAKAGPLGAGNAARRREWRILGVGMGLLRHDGAG